MIDLAALISVIVPVYNVKPYLGRCVDSILNQSHRELEVILINDGSTDGSAALCRQYAAKDSRVKVIEQSNQGVSTARNVGIEAATGTYLAFVDGDDTIERDMYECLLAALEREKCAAAVCLFAGMLVPAAIPSEPQWKDLWYSLLRGDLLMSSLCNKLYRTEAWTGLHIDLGIRFTEDLWINAQIFSRMPGAVLVQKPFYHYEERRDSAVQTILSEKHFDGLEVSERLSGLANSLEEKDCVLRQRILIQFSLVNRMIKSGSFQERYPELRQMLLGQKKEILKNPYSTRKEIWGIRLLDKAPGLYRAAVRMKG